MTAKLAAQLAFGTAAFDHPVKRAELSDKFKISNCHGYIILNGDDTIGSLHSGDVLAITFPGDEYIGKGLSGVECVVYEGPAVEPQLDEGQFRFPDHNNMVFKPDEFVGLKIEVCQLAENPLCQRPVCCQPSDQSVIETDLSQVAEVGYD
jgi:hypothetical protein